ncbi:MAG: hypothetical protein MK132_25545 [Lentisphaerales bacterium]|nr:hypothetical protein [Lentisphaerales bacterium]
MKRLISFFFIAFFAMSVQAQDEKAWSISIDQGIYDKYIWRGIQFNEEGVNQGALDASYDMGDLGTFGANVWYNLDLDSENSEANDFSEVDYTFYWEKNFDSLTIGAGHIYYDFSEVNLGSTREVYVSAGLDVILAPSITVYYDYEDVDGFYVDLSIGHSFELTEELTLNLGANLGWADDDQAEAYYGADENGQSGDSGFTNYALSASLDFAVCENVTVTPSVMYYGLLEDANEEKFDDGDSVGLEDDDFVFGINLNVSF